MFKRIARVIIGSWGDYMLILPIVNRKRILNVRISLKDAQKVNKKVHLPGVAESDVIVNGHMFSKSIYNEKNNNTKKSVVEFIRNSSLLFKRSFTITTKSSDDTDLYDVYRVECPPSSVNEALELLYGSVIVDMKMEIPNKVRSKYISLKDLGFGECLSDEKISKLYKITSSMVDGAGLDEIYKKKEIADLVRIIDFMDLFDCTVVSEASISEEIFTGVLNSFQKLGSRDTKSMRRYYNIALDNRDIYSKLSQINKILYNRPYSLIGSESQKRTIQFVKTNQNSGGDSSKDA